jgi:hypothetical protein
MNGCDYRFSAAGTVKIECPETKRIRLETRTTGCVYEVGPQTLSGVAYSTIGASPNRDVTVSVNVTGIAVTVVGTRATCLIAPSSSGDTLEGTYTTGNTIVTAETGNGSGTMADGWL